MERAFLLLKSWWSQQNIFLFIGTPIIKRFVQPEEEMLRQDPAVSHKSKWQLQRLWSQNLFSCTEWLKEGAVVPDLSLEHSDCMAEKKNLNWNIMAVLSKMPTAAMESQSLNSAPEQIHHCCSPVFVILLLWAGSLTTWCLLINTCTKCCSYKSVLAGF